MHVPSVEEANRLLSEAEKMNPGPWADHCRCAADAARRIAAPHPDLDPDVAATLGLLHDIGRRFGISGWRHATDGYRFMNELGYPDVGQICVTHMFMRQDKGLDHSNNDLSPDDRAFIEKYVPGLIYTDYDRLIQLCDYLALANGFCFMETRMVNGALRFGVGGETVATWEKAFEIKKHFEEKIGFPVYDILPGIEANTRQFDTLGGARLAKALWNPRGEGK